LGVMVMWWDDAIIIARFLRVYAWLALAASTT
jgi:hypothetical protein